MTYLPTYCTETRFSLYDDMPVGELPETAESESDDDESQEAFG